MKKTIVLLIVLIVSVLSFWAGGRYGKGPSSGTGSQQEREVLYYIDPMTPGFRSNKPGLAPCGMPLEPVYAEEGDGQRDTAAGGMSDSPGAVKIRPDRQQLIGVEVTAVEKKPMAYRLRLYGRVVPDETKIYVVNASTDSWIRELSDVTTGSIVQKNQVLAEALAPAYYNAQLTYLIALDNIDRIRKQLGGQLRHQQGDLANNQIRVAVQALQNLGITDAQTRELANTRQARPYLEVRAPSRGVVLRRKVTLNQWFKASEEFYTIVDIGRVWVYADVYEDETIHLRPGMPVEVVHKQMHKAFRAKVGEVLPLFDPVSKTLEVRIDVDNPQYDLRPDMFVDVEIPITLPASVHIPADAVIDSGTRTIVYVDMGNGVFEPRRVETGWRLGRRIEITGGLTPGEKVVVSGNFLIDSECRMRTAASGPERRMSRDPVCGRYADEQEAVFLKRTAAYANETFYFCSEACRRVFEEEPQKFARKEQTAGKYRKHVAVGEKSTWADLLKPINKGRAIKDSVTGSDKDGKDDSGEYPTSPGVVDWDGDEEEGAPPRDWGAWGAFPGAKYLGLKQKPRNKTLTPSKFPEAEGEKTHDVEESDSDSAPSPDVRDSDRPEISNGTPTE